MSKVDNTVTNLYIINFDNFENNAGAAKTKMHIASFTEDKEKHLSSQGSCAKWIKENLKVNNFYLGWDGEIYPKYVTETKDILNLNLYDHERYWREDDESSKELGQITASKKSKIWGWCCKSK